MSELFFLYLSELFFHTFLTYLSPVWTFLAHLSDTFFHTCPNCSFTPVWAVFHTDLTYFSCLKCSFTPVWTILSHTCISELLFHSCLSCYFMNSVMFLHTCLKCYFRPVRDDFYVWAVILVLSEILFHFCLSSVQLSAADHCALHCWIACTVILSATDYCFFVLLDGDCLDKNNNFGGVSHARSWNKCVEKIMYPYQSVYTVSTCIFLCLPVQVKIMNLLVMRKLNALLSALTYFVTYFTLCTDLFWPFTCVGLAPYSVVRSCGSNRFIKHWFVRAAVRF